ncbi:MAG: sigma-70 family RNA polymerase sigma factor [Pseudomonadota bacterium]
MQFILSEQTSILDGFISKETSPGQVLHSSMDSFLASVEKQAFVIAMAACKDEQIALDVVQDSMLSMVKNYAGKNAESWPPLFFRILNNRITDQHRKRGFGRFTQWFGTSRDDGSEPEAVDQLAGDEFSPDALADANELQDAMQAALENLSFKQQQALILRLWQGLSVKETALAMGVSEGSVKTHLSRAVQEMRLHLDEYKPG